MIKAGGVSAVQSVGMVPMIIVFDCNMSCGFYSTFRGGDGFGLRGIQLRNVIAR
jgi:hypothetical protein